MIRMSPEDVSAARLWQEWHQRRLDVVRAPYGPLSVTGTYWLADATTEGRLSDLPGRWRVLPEGVEVRADILEGLAVSGEPLVGSVVLTPHPGDRAAKRLTHGERRLELLRREGGWAVRVHDPNAPARQTFSGLRTTPYDPLWVLRGRFHRYERVRTVQVANADGCARGLELSGELEFTVPSGEHSTLQVSLVGTGALWTVFADATSGESSYRFRFLRTSAPDVNGLVTVDFNRATLPPSALADHFLCPFPPPGNTLRAPVPAGERDVA